MLYTQLSTIAPRIFPRILNRLITQPIRIADSRNAEASKRNMPLRVARTPTRRTHGSLDRNGVAGQASPSIEGRNLSRPEATRAGTIRRGYPMLGGIHRILRAGARGFPTPGQVDDVTRGILSRRSCGAGAILESTRGQGWTGHRLDQEWTERPLWLRSVRAVQFLVVRVA